MNEWQRLGRTVFQVRGDGLEWHAEVSASVTAAGPSDPDLCKIATEPDDWDVMAYRETPGTDETKPRVVRCGFCGSFVPEPAIPDLDNSRCNRCGAELEN